jgi:hypothetical protein
MNLSQSEIARLDDAAVPDAIFQIAGVPSPIMRNLIVTRNYRLVALPFGGSFNLGKFRETDMPDLSETKTLGLDKSFVEEFVIPAFVYSVLPAVPPVDTRTIATRLMLVGSKRVDDSVVRRVLELILSPEISSLAKPELSVELLNSSFQFERHPGTVSYLNSLKPYDVDGAFSAYGRLVEVWGIIIAAYFAAARWVKSWRERKDNLPSGAVGDFLGQVLAVEAQANTSISEEERIRLDRELTDIKKRSIQLHLDGRLADSEELQSLLVTLADTRTKIWRSPA